MEGRGEGGSAAIVRALTIFEGLSGFGQSIESCQCPDNRPREGTRGYLAWAQASSERVHEVRAAARESAPGLGNTQAGARLVRESELTLFA
jgi:hypothetical protein